MPLLSISPIGGLCNRMRALNSAMALAGVIGSRVELVWCRDRTLNCRFADLFQPPAGISRIVELDLHTWRGRVLKRLLVASRSGFGKCLYSQAQIAEAMAANRSLGLELAGRRVFMETGSAFHPTQDFSKFIPVPLLAEIVQGYASRLANAAGVHLRRTDNTHSRRHSPLNRFAEQMTELLAGGHCKHFFLASDAPDEEQKLREIFPGHIMSHSKTSYDRDNAAAIKDALIDLYCLAQCSPIVGSYWSSFSETAAAIGHRELLVVKSPDHLGP